MGKAITIAELYADKLPKIPDGLIEDMDKLLKQNCSNNPLVPIEVNLSAIEELMITYKSEVGSEYESQHLLQAIILHYETSMRVRHGRNNTLHFGPNFDEDGDRPLRTNVQLHTIRNGIL